ncbi:ExbD/TolR family protein [Silicimonas sp. MF1-12-2]|uniref:ExbD/TolR family protein n=1 Tax=Silicimonas sp. MF1-12-2 TaxID=3384793 RepID=UPI0039B45A68
MNLTRPMRLRRMALTPMIDVVFLLLIFFMLAARFGQEGTIEISAGGQGTVYDGPPRLVEVYPEAVRLNGVPVSVDQLITSLAELTKDSDDIVVLRMREGADVQRLVDVIQQLKDGGFSSPALVE